MLSQLHVEIARKQAADALPKRTQFHVHPDTVRLMVQEFSGKIEDITPGMEGAFNGFTLLALPSVKPGVARVVLDGETLAEWDIARL